MDRKKLMNSVPEETIYINTIPQKKLTLMKRKWLGIWIPFFIKIKVKKPFFKNENTKKIAIILEEKQKEVIKEFQSLFSELNLAHQLHFLVFDKEKKNTLSQNTFSMDDIGWTGTFSTKLKRAFFNYKYDVLINYYQNPSDLLTLAAYHCKNNVSMGFANSKRAYTDLIFNFKMDWELVKKELPKYLHITKE